MLIYVALAYLAGTAIAAYAIYKDKPVDPRYFT